MAAKQVRYKSLNMVRINFAADFKSGNLKTQQEYLKRVDPKEREALQFYMDSSEDAWSETPFTAPARKVSAEMLAILAPRTSNHDLRRGRAAR